MKNFNEELLNALGKIKGSGTFVSVDTKPFAFSGLEIQGVDEIGFPINASQAKEIIKVAHKASFGKGSQTVLDTTVRSAWEIDASKIQFNSKEWEKFIDNLVKQIKPDLGIEEHTVTANLYKLLVYETGDFFLAHKDSEKEKGMFGTLIVGLPAKHTGGELLVRFDGKEEVIDFSEPSSQNKIPYAAFYADCEHEIKPITSGYRVCLVYNLVQIKAEQKIQLNQLGSHVETLTNILKTCEEDENVPKIVLLGHQYTPSNFTIQSLKLNDRPKAEALLQAAENAGFYAKLGLVTSYQSGELEEGNSRSSKYGRRKSYYDDDYDDDELAENGTMGEIYDESLEIEHWLEEGIPPLRDIKFDKNDLISDIKLNEGEPDEKMAEGYTGNAGMEMQYWYHYGAVFFWPKKYQYGVLIGLPKANQLEWITYYNQKWSDIKVGEVDLMKRLIEGNETENNEKIDFTPIANFLINLKDETYLNLKGKAVLVQNFKMVDIDSWINLLETYPSHHFEEVFAAVAQKQKRSFTNHIFEILVKLYTTKSNHREFISNQINQIPEYLKALELSKNEGKTKAILQNTLVLSTQKNEDETWLKNTTNAFGRVLTRAYVNKVLLEEILSIDAYKNATLAKNLISLCKTDLTTRINNKPQPPADWSRKMPKVEGYYEKIWAILKDFIESPTKQYFDYTKLQADRKDMERAVERVTIDLKTETIRKGSPHTLRLTKTQSAYEKELANWNEDVKLLAKAEKWELK